MRRIFIHILLILFSVSLFAQTSFRGRAPQTAYVGEGFTIQYSISCKDRPSNFEIPTVNGANIVSGPYQGSSSSTTIINGQVSSSHSYTFSIVLQATRAGKVTVSPARIKADGKVYSSQGFAIDVRDRNSNSGGGNNYNRGYNYNNQQRNNYTPQPQQRNANPQKTSINIDNQALFVRAIPNKTNVVKGEEVVISYKLYTLLPVSEYSIQKIPSSIGFWIEELDRQETPSLSIEEYNGQRYQVAILRKVIVYPQRTGKLTIQGMPLSIVAHVQTHSQRQFSTGDPFFDRFLNDPFFSSVATSYQRVEKNLKTNAVTINVAELPKPQAENYVGGVGTFNITSSMSNSKIKAFDAFYLTYTIEGQGNLTLINSLPLKLPDEFQISDPEITDHISKTGAGLTGTRTFKYLVIPSVEGDFKIPQLSISYYDVKTKEYKNITAEGYNIHVAKGDASSGYAKQLDERAKYRNMDIIPTKNISLNAKEKHIFDRAFVYILFVIFVAITLILISIYSKYLASLSDVVATKRRRATRVAVKRLKKAKKLLTLQQYEDFEDEIAIALWNYLLDRFKIEKSKFSVESCAEKLISEDISKETVDNLVSIFNRCQYIRFSQDKQINADDSIYNDTINVITSIEEEMKQNKKNVKTKEIEEDILSNIRKGLPILLFITVLFISSFAIAENNNKKEALTSKDLCTKAETYFHNSDYANAMLYYEKALKLSPNDKEIKLNINIVRSRLMGDCFIMSEWFPIRIVKYIAGTMSLVMWAFVMIILLVVSCVAFFFYRFSERKVLMFYVCIIAFILSLCSMGFGIERQNMQNDDSNAIIMTSGIKLKSSRNDSSKDILTLYKGQKIKIIERESNKWIKVRTEDRREGYINSSDYKRI